MKKPAQEIVVVLAGLGAGLTSGLLGVGGGIVIIPLLTLVVGMHQHDAHATSLIAIVPIAAAGAATFAVHGEVDYAAGLLLAAGSLAGAPLGARLMARIREGWLRIISGAVMWIVAAVMLWT